MESAQMTEDTLTIDVLDSRARRREDRRDLFRMMGGKALMAGTATVAATTSAFAQTAAPTDADILNSHLTSNIWKRSFTRSRRSAPG
jgi:hypothetical protein